LYYYDEIKYDSYGNRTTICGYDKNGALTSYCVYLYK